MDRLEGELRDCAGGSVVQVCAALLRACRRGSRALLRQMDDPADRKHFEELRLEFCAFFEDLGSVSIDAEDIDALIDRLQLIGWNTLGACAAAGGLDGAWGVQFSLLFTGQRRLEGGDPFPVFPNHAFALFGPRVSSQPANIAMPVDATARLRLFEASDRCDVILQTAPVQTLPAIKLSTRIGFGLLNGRIDRDHTRSELRWDRYVKDEVPVFAAFGPVDPAEQAARVKWVVEEALRLRVDLLVLPELCVTAEDVDAVRTLLVNVNPRPLVVAGSHHLKVSERYRNRAVTFLPTGEEFWHDKFERFDFKDFGDDGALPEVRRAEDVLLPRELRVLITPHASLCVVVCKDFLPDENRRLLAHLGVCVVLVPAMSHKDAFFDANAQSLTAHGQSIIAIANE